MPSKLALGAVQWRIRSPCLYPRINSRVLDVAAGLLGALGVFVWSLSVSLKREHGNSYAAEGLVPGSLQDLHFAELLIMQRMRRSGTQHVRYLDNCTQGL